MRLVIPGGCGFVGANFLDGIFRDEKTASLFDEIVVVDILQYDKSYIEPRILVNKKVRFVKRSVYEEETISKVVRKGDVIVHLAVEENTFENPQEHFSTNFENYLRLLTKRQIARFIFISTADVYGINSSRNLVETDVVRPTTIYSAGKLAFEAYLQAFFSLYGFPMVIFRPVTIYGPRQHPGWLIPRVITRGIKNMPIQITGDGSVKRDWIFVDDVCEVIIKAITRNKVGVEGEVFNLGTGREKSVLEVTKSILDLLDKPDSLIKYIPPRQGEILRQVTLALKAQKTFGWVPLTKFSEGLKNTVNWYKDNFE